MVRIKILAVFVLAVVFCNARPATAADDAAQRMNSIELNTAAALAHKEQRVDDAAFLFLTGQMRRQIDRKVYPSAEKRDEIGALLGALASGIGAGVLEPVRTDAKRLETLIPRIVAWAPQFDEKYDPGWKHHPPIPAEQRDAIVAKVREGVLHPLWTQKILISNKEYAAAVAEVKKAEEESSRALDAWARIQSPPEAKDAYKLARKNRDAAHLKRQRLLWNLLPESRWHHRHKWVAEKYFNDPQVIALCRAIEKDDLPEMKRLIDAGANVKALGTDGMTPLLWSYPDMRFERFELLLQSGADPNVFLHNESGLGTWDPKKGNSPHTRPGGSSGMGFGAGQTVTHLAAASPYSKYLVAVVAHGGDAKLVIEKTGETPLDVAVHERSHNDKVEQAKLLIKHGADPNRLWRYNEWHGKYPIQGLTAHHAYCLELLQSGVVKLKSYPEEQRERIVHLILRDEKSEWSYKDPVEGKSYRELIAWVEKHLPKETAKAREAQDEHSMKGNWNIALFQHGGALDQSLTGRDVQISSGNVSLPKSENESTRMATLALNCSTSPKQIAWIDRAGQFEHRGNRWLLGLYNLQGDTLIICMANRNDRPRPASFVSTKKNGEILIVLHRKKR